MPLSWRQRRCTYSRGSALSDARQKPIQLRQRDPRRLKAIARANENVVETAIAALRGVGASIVVIVVIAVVRSTVAIAGIAVTVDDRLIAGGPPTAAVARDVIATGRERTEWTLPPGRWLG